MPVIAVIVFECSTVSGSQNKSTRFVGERIVLLVDEWSEGMIGHVDTIGIHFEFCARSTVLQVVLIVMLSHVCTFNKWFQGYRIVVIHSKSFPSVYFRLQSE